MKNFDLKVFEQNMQATKIALREGILSINIWNLSTGLILADWQGNPTATALLTQLIAELNDTFVSSGQSELKAEDYLYMDLQQNQALVVINHGNDIMQGWLVDSSKASPGILLGMAIPNAIANIAAAK